MLKHQLVILVPVCWEEGKALGSEERTAMGNAVFHWICYRGKKLSKKLHLTLI
jgi:hypothetical protein